MALSHGVSSCKRMDKLKEEKTLWPYSHTLQRDMPLTHLPSHVSMFVHVLSSFRVSGRIKFNIPEPIFYLHLSAVSPMICRRPHVSSTLVRIVKQSTWMMGQGLKEKQLNWRLRLYFCVEYCSFHVSRCKEQEVDCPLSMHLLPAIS